MYWMKGIAISFATFAAGFLGSVAAQAQDYKIGYITELFPGRWPALTRRRGRASTCT